MSKKRDRDEPNLCEPAFLRDTLAHSHAIFVLVDALNNHPSHPATVRFRPVVDYLLEEGLTQRTIDEFNRRFGAEVMPLRLIWDEHDGRTFVFPDVSLGNLPIALWQLLRSDQPTRLRRCPVCRTYFFDPTRNASKHYCSKRCASQTTSRTYRARQAESWIQPRA
jgi:hypothetical protein